MVIEELQAASEYKLPPAEVVARVMAVLPETGEALL